MHTNAPLCSSTTFVLRSFLRGLQVFDGDTDFMRDVIRNQHALFFGRCLSRQNHPLIAASSVQKESHCLPKTIVNEAYLALAALA